MFNEVTTRFSFVSNRHWESVCFVVAAEKFCWNKVLFICKKYDQIFQQECSPMESPKSSSLKEYIMSQSKVKTMLICFCNQMKHPLQIYSSKTHRKSSNLLSTFGIYMAAHLAKETKSLTRLVYFAYDNAFPQNIFGKAIFGQRINTSVGIATFLTRFGLVPCFFMFS